MIEQLLSQPGFIYEINGKYYFLGKSARNAQRLMHAIV